MTIKIIKSFKARKENKFLKAGETYEFDDERIKDFTAKLPDYFEIVKKTDKSEQDIKKSEKVSHKAKKEG